MKLSIALVSLAALSGCSALVNPDPGRLDGHDGSVATDATPGRDGGPEVDGNVPSDDGGGTDAPPVCEGGCDDGVDCTNNSCVVGVCTFDPDDTECGDGERCDPTDGCVTRPCDSDEDCQNGVFCDGDEVCMPGAKGASALGCLPAVAPRDCNDGYACTEDSCVEDARSCANRPDDGACNDSVDCTMDACNPSASGEPSGCVITPDDSLCPYCLDGVTCDASLGCVGGVPRDCRDGDPCTVERCDEPTRMCEAAPRDDDLDGYPAAMVSGMACGGTDCNDAAPTINPGATEMCNGADDNCDGRIDEGCTVLPDTCATAQALRVTDDGTPTVVMGRFSAFSAHYDPPSVCGPGGGRDAVYYVDVDSLVDLTIDTIGSTADTVLAVGLDCSNSGFRLGCDDDINTGMDYDSRVWVHRVGPPAGSLTRRVYILVDGYNASTTGDFTLRVSMTAAAPDACSGTPIDITGGGSLVGFAAPSTLPATTERGSCQSSAEAGEAEAIARLTVPGSGSMAFDAYSYAFDPDLYLRASPCATGTEIDCNDGDGGGMSGYTYHTRVESSASAGSTTYFFCDGVSAAGAYFVAYEP